MYIFVVDLSFQQKLKKLKYLHVVTFRIFLGNNERNNFTLLQVGDTDFHQEMARLLMRLLVCKTF